MRSLVAICCHTSLQDQRSCKCCILKRGTWWDMDISVQTHKPHKPQNQQQHQTRSLIQLKVSQKTILFWIWGFTWCWDYRKFFDEVLNVRANSHVSQLPKSQFNGSAGYLRCWHPLKQPPRVISWRAAPLRAIGLRLSWCLWGLFLWQKTLPITNPRSKHTHTHTHTHRSPINQSSCPKNVFLTKTI